MLAVAKRIVTFTLLFSSVFTFVFPYLRPQSSLTGLPTSGGRVPEFSTVVYIFTVALLFGLVFWKKNGEALQNA